MKMCFVSLQSADWSFLGFTHLNVFQKRIHGVLFWEFFQDEHMESLVGVLRSEIIIMPLCHKDWLQSVMGAVLTLAVWLLSKCCVVLLTLPSPACCCVSLPVCVSVALCAVCLHGQSIQYSVLCSTCAYAPHVFIQISWALNQFTLVNSGGRSTDVLVFAAKCI